MTQTPVRAFFALSTLSLAAAPSRADVLVVDDDGGPGVDYITVAAAISGSSPGDLILVRDGVYSSFSVDTTSLIIAADTGASPVVGRAAFNTQDPLAGACAMIGIDVAFEGLAPLPALEVRGDKPVWIQGCTVTDSISAPIEQLHAALVADGAHLFIDTNVAGLTPNLDAIGVAADAAAYVYGGVIEGGPGNDDSKPDGGAGVSINTFQGNSKLAAYGALIRGGSGADGDAKQCAGSAGRSPVVPLLSPWGGEFYEVLVVDSALEGGAGGAGFGGCADGAAGASPGVEPAHLNLQPGTARHLAMTSPTRPFETVTATFTGDEGDLVIILKSFEQGVPIPIPGIVGAYQLGVPVFVGSLGTIPASGVLQIDHTMGSLASVSGHLAAHYQGLIVDQSGELALTNPVTALFLGPGF